MRHRVQRDQMGTQHPNGLQLRAVQTMGGLPLLRQMFQSKSGRQRGQQNPCHLLWIQWYLLFNPVQEIHLIRPNRFPSPGLVSH